MRTVNSRERWYDLTLCRLSTSGSLQVLPFRCALFEGATCYMHLCLAIYVMKYFPISLLLLFSTVVSGQVVRLSSLQETLDLARKQNSSIRSSELQNRIAQTDGALAQSGLYPSLSLSGTSDYNLKLPVQLIPAEIFGGTAGTFKAVQFGRSWNSSASAVFEMPLLHPDKYAQARAGKLSREQVELEQIAQQRSALQRVTSVYFNLLVLQKALELNTELDSTANALYEATRARFNQQLVSRVDLNRSENLRNSNLQQTLQLRSNLQVAQQTLCILLGFSPSADVQVNDALEKYAPLNSSIPEINPENRPSYQATLKAEEAARWKMRQNAYAALPKLSINSRYTFASQADRLFSGNGTNFDYGTVGMSLNVPLFKGRNTALQTRKSRIQLDLARVSKEQQLLSSGSEILEWQVRLREKEQARSLAATRDANAAQNLDLSIISYDQGVISLDQLFTIYNEYVQARNSYLQAMSDGALYRTYLELEK